MTTDTKAVARFDAGSGVNPRANGKYVLFTDHERVVGELTREAKGLSQSLTETFKSEEELRAALAATGKQQVGEVESLPPEMRPSDPEYLDYLDGPKQVGEVHGGERAQFEAWVKHRDVELTCWGDGSYTDPTVNADWAAWQAALAARQPGAQVPYAWLIEWKNSVTALTKVASEAEEHSDYKNCTVVPVYTAPHAQGISLGQFRDSVIHECLRAHAEWQGDLISYDEYLIAEQKRDRLLALIDQRDAAPGAGNG